MAGVSLMALVTGYAWWRTIEQPATIDESTERIAPSPQSIAVLPFVNMSGDPDNERVDQLARAEAVRIREAGSAG